eukprot:TRINITY_DN3820_c0_g1_i2.p1 TRINITY_DN3820_c0_g1~~TRINITY_DN3820_c0_g1_i2.p1  ORF type:complete len:201 (-),score=25.68 TRINITY_DN3820_c0_g1_i2:436-1038(-)
MMGTKLNVVVIGGSNGIGREIVKEFASFGHRVLTTYFSNQKASLHIQKLFPNVDYCYIDQGDLNSIERFTEKCKEWLYANASPNRRCIDILIHNAALGSSTIVDYVKSKLEQNGQLEAWDSMSDFRKNALEDEALMKVNSLGPLWITDSLMPYIRSIEKNGEYQNRDFGTIVFIDRLVVLLAFFQNIVHRISCRNRPFLT